MALASNNAEAAVCPVPSVTVSSESDLEGAIPFGIRALEKGVEVEGVWVSRTNTPATSIIGDSRPPSLGGEPSSARPQIVSGHELDLRRAVGLTPDRRSIRTDHSPHREMSGNLDRSSDLLGSTSSPASISSLTADGNTTQMFIDHHRNTRSTRPSLVRNSATLESVEGVSQHRNSTSESQSTGGLEVPRIPQFRFSRGPPNSRTSRDPQRHSAEEFLASVELARRPSGHLNPAEAAAHIDKLFQTRRSHQAAEAGDLSQLKHRSHSLQPFKTYGNDDISLQPSSSLPALEASAKHSPGSSPLLLPQDNEVYTMQRSPDFGSFTRTTHEPHSPPQASLAQNSTPIGTSPVSHSDPVSAKDETPITEMSDMALPPPFSVNRNSQVLRKVNSGFEIMMPGTYDKPPEGDPHEDSSGGKRRSRRLQKPPPRAIETQQRREVSEKVPLDDITNSANGNRSSLESKRQLKRLRKKRRKSNSSFVSADSSASSQSAHSVKFTATRTEID